MPYRSFLTYNIAGALVWGIGTVLIGYLAGEAAISAVESASIYAAALVSAAGSIAYLLHRRRTSNRIAGTPNS
jgi:membrane protein DedA with SNARE-associated domain